MPNCASSGPDDRLAGGNAGGAVRIGDTVRRPTGPWTPAVHAVLRHLEAVGFARAPRVLGTDEQGREVLDFIHGLTVGDRTPWPAWTHSDSALVQVARWLADYHVAVAGFVPPADAVWRYAGRPWRPGDIIGHNDAAPYNAVWSPGGELLAFFDWDFCSPCSPLWDLAFTAFSWTPLHARPVIEAEGFTTLADRPRRLHLFLDTYGYTGSVEELLDAVRHRLDALAEVTLVNARHDPVFARMVHEGHVDGMRLAQHELHQERAIYLR